MKSSHTDIRCPATVGVEIELPASKSISNRALILNALSHSSFAPDNLSDCDDTRVMVSALRDMPQVIDIGAAGTAMRFLTAYLSVTPGEHVITGSERMRQRPIGVLVDALRRLGADITYEGQEGYPPLRIVGQSGLAGGRLRVSAGISSQYLSALLMIAPTLRQGLTLELEGRIVSRPYLEMTIRMMHAFGVQVGWTDDHTIHVEPGTYKTMPYTIENDWSAASYWYEIVSLTSDPDAWVVLPGLPSGSLQGDSCVRDIFTALGVATEECSSHDGRPAIRLRKAPGQTVRFDYDFTDCPDLAQTVAVTCALKGIPCRLSGVESLRIKETDRLAAVCRELNVLGYQLRHSDCLLEWDGTCTVADADGELPAIHTYADHRMAMAFAPACCCGDAVRILDPAVVSKSYPTYWDDLRKAGFQLCN